MTEDDRNDLLRDLVGELSPERKRVLDARLAVEPALSRARDQIAARWGDLELPTPAPAPAEFPRRLRARVEREEQAGLFTSGLLPATAAATMLTAGVALGVWLGGGLAVIATPAATPATSAVALAAPTVPIATAALETPDEVGLTGLEGETLAEAYLALFITEDTAR